MTGTASRSDDELPFEELDHPAQSARTRRFSLGRPRAFTILPDPARVLFLRSGGPLDPVLRLWSLDVTSGAESVLVDPSRLGDVGDLPPEERARRERARESAGGIVAYSCDRDGTAAAFTLAGRLHTVDLATGAVREQDAPAGAYDPHVDPTGRRVGFVAGGAFHVAAIGGEHQLVAGDDDPDVTHGVADFVAAEEMSRQRGFWWSPDGERVLVERVDNRAVPLWHVADPANPSTDPAPHRYPAAGTTNATVSLHLFDAGGGDPVAVEWDRDAFPYLAQVRWDDAGPGLITVQSRDQRRLQVLAFDGVDGSTRLVAEQQGEPWLEVPVGTPRWLDDGRLLTTIDDLDAGPWGTRRLAADGEALTPEGLQVARVAGQDDAGIWFVGTTEATEQHVWTLSPTGQVERRTSQVGLHDVVVRDGTHVLLSSLPDTPEHRVEVSRGGEVAATIPSHHARPTVEPRPRQLRLGADELRAALLLPSDDDGTSPLPVVLDPYGGPHAQRVVQASLAFATSQWLADQGFAVLVCDGRGTPSRGPGWEHRIHLDLAEGVLDDQITALRAAAKHEPRLDLDRVAIRGWSFGGYLAALAVLRRPDVFRAGVAGAPVTDWRLYDTHYTERYLGTDAAAASYRDSSLIDDEGLVGAAAWDDDVPELLIVHGLADDNVVAAHGLRLSAALLADGRPHRFLPLSGVTHMTPQATVATNLPRLELAFLRQALDVG